MEGGVLKGSEARALTHQRPAEPTATKPDLPEVLGLGLAQVASYWMANCVAHVHRQQVRQRWLSCMHVQRQSRIRLPAPSFHPVEHSHTHEVLLGKNGAGARRGRGMRSG